MTFSRKKVVGMEGRRLAAVYDTTLTYLGKPSKKNSGQTWDIVPSSLPPTHPIEVGTHMRKKFRWPDMSYINMAISQYGI